MNQKKTGAFIAECRKEQNMTQAQLAEHLGVSDRSVSNWENGRNMPDISLFVPLCELLGMTLNELFAGERIKEENYKEVADSNLMQALEQSAFTWKEKMDFFKRKWRKDHLARIICSGILWAAVILLLKFCQVKLIVIGYFSGLLGVLLYIVLYNQMMAYAESNVFTKVEKTDRQ